MKPLAGMRILAIEVFGAGPYGSMFLAELGAEVIKIENPHGGGDPARHVGPHLLGENDSVYFQSLNLGKKSVVLDVKSTEGQASMRQLARASDAILNNLRGDQPARLGIDYASLKDVNPAIVCLHISAYGRDNDRRDWPGYDYLMQAETGMMSLTGEPEGPPTRSGTPIVDFMTGMTGVVGLLSGVLQARQTGIGCDIDVSLFDVALHQLSYAGYWYLNAGDVPQRQSRGAHLSVAPAQTCRTRDGWIFVMCMLDKFWEALVGVLEQPELKRDPRFATAAARRDNREALTRELDRVFAVRSTTEWLACLTGVIPVAPVMTVPEAFGSPFIRETAMIGSVAHPNGASLRTLLNPLKINGERLPQTACAALGADGRQLLKGEG
jgi:crotonobetainyl-CoA:carnitine CoA-transferase CaiB-like acyl-CoA transferase